MTAAFPDAHERRRLRFAAIVPVGPDAIGLWRGIELIRSLLSWEPELGWCIVLDDAPRPRGLSELVGFPSTCRATTLLTPPMSAGESWIGRLTGGIIAALAWLQSNADADFVLRIDADALVIGPFARAVSTRLAATTDAGVIGTLGLSSHPAVRMRENHNVEPKLLKSARLLSESDRPPTECCSSVLNVPGVGTFDANQRRAFEIIRPHIERAVSRGYRSNEFCQGGVNVISRLMVERLSERGYLSSADAWAALPFADDRVMAMYARAVDVQLCDYSAPGEPFGVQARGLPYAPDELLERGHSLIHSVRNDRRFDEMQIRDFFRHRAQSAVRRLSG
jgi:hypothetical protein